jgi:hypothetical protein
MASAPTGTELVCLGPVKRGRTSSWTQEIADEICNRIANGETLTEICRDDAMPSRATVTEWLMRDREGFSSQYARAREIQAIHEDDECKAIADNAYEDYYLSYDDDGKPVIKVDGNSVQRAKLRIETRRWRAERLNRRVYGNSTRHEIELPAATANGAEQLPAGLAWLAGQLPAPETRPEPDDSEVG